jgi:hypothetical protein
MINDFFNGGSLSDDDEDEDEEQQDEDQDDASEIAQRLLENDARKDKENRDPRSTTPETSAGPAPKRSRDEFEQQPATDSPSEPEIDESPDVSQDTGFQNDPRIVDLDRSKRRRMDIQQPLPEPSVPRRDKSSTIRGRPAQQALVRTGPPGAAPATASLPPQPAATKLSYEEVRSTARIAQQKKGPKKPQSRVFWDNDETNALIELIEEHGTSWSFLLQEGGHRFDEKRDQTALKDKARNIKVEYLLYGSLVLD